MADSRKIMAAVAAVLGRPSERGEIIDRLEETLRVNLAAEWVRVVVAPSPEPAHDGGAVVDARTVAVPLILDDTAIGRLVVGVPSGADIHASLAETLEVVAFPIAAGIGLRAQELTARTLREAAHRDALTTVKNRGALDDALADAWSRAQQAGSQLAFVIADVDFFKNYNDRYGHQGGDECLRRIARALDDQVRDGDATFARYGGEEFSVVLPGADIAGAIAVAERMRAAIGVLAIPHAGSSLGVVTASFGIGSMVPTADDRSEQLVGMADHALYRAKLQGRNCVCADGYRSASERVRRRAPARISVPEQKSRFFGREMELERVALALRDNRFVNLVGPAGIGKTRLVQTVLSQQGDRFPDGIVYIDVSAVAPGDDPSPVVLAALESSFGQSLPNATIGDIIGGRELLLAIDNGEHIAALCSVAIAHWLESCPSVAVLAASRISFDVGLGTTIRVGPLADSDAIELFVDRVRDVRPDIDVSELFRSRALQVVKRLDAVPLAIELAAPRLRRIGVEQLLEELADYNDPVVSSAADESDAIAAAVSWSYRQLAPAVCVTFELLSVFRGSFTSEHARAVLGTDAEDVAASVSELVKQSLLSIEGTDGDERFRMLRSVRQFGRSRLATRGGFDRAMRAHVRLFSTLAESLLDPGNRFSGGQWLDRVETDLDDFELALEYCSKGTPDGERASGAAPIIRLLARFFAGRGLFQTALRLSETYRAIEAALAPQLRPDVLGALALIASNAGRVSTAVSLSRDALAIYERLDDDSRVAFARAGLGCALLAAGSFEDAYIRLQEAVASEIVGRDARRAAVVRCALGQLENDFFRRPQSGRAAIESGIAVLRQIGDTVNLIVALAHLAESYRQLGDLDAASASAREALTLADSIGNAPYALVSLAKLAAIEASRERRQEVRRLLRLFIDRYREVAAEGYAVQLAPVFENLARAAVALEEPHRAARFAKGLLAQQRSSEQRLPPVLVREMTDYAAAFPLEEPPVDAAELLTEVVLL